MRRSRAQAVLTGVYVLLALNAWYLRRAIRRANLTSLHQITLG